MDRTTDNHNITVEHCDRCGVPESIVGLHRGWHEATEHMLVCEDCDNAVGEQYGP